MDKKQSYNAPEMETMEVTIERALLTNSAEAMRTVNGSWDNEEDW